jgi:HAD superfamily hydrolase (TIGR01509 family)
LKAVLFDLDGVLVDSMPLHWEVEEEVCKHFGLDFQKLHNNVSFAGITEREMFTALAKRTGKEHAVEEMLKMKHKLYLQRMERVEIIEDAVLLFKECMACDLKTGIVSSSSRVIVHKMLEKLGIRKATHCIVTADDVREGKPSPEPYLKAARLLEVKPQECIAIEDSQAGVIAAKKAGMICVGFRNPHSSYKNTQEDLSNADVVIENFNELSVDVLNNIWNRYAVSNAGSH